MLEVGSNELFGIAQFTKKPIRFFLPIQDTRDELLTGKEWQLIARFRNIYKEEPEEAALDTLEKLGEVRKPKGKK